MLSSVFNYRAVSRIHGSNMLDPSDVAVPSHTANSKGYLSELCNARSMRELNSFEVGSRLMLCTHRLICILQNEAKMPDGVLNLFIEMSRRISESCPPFDDSFQSLDDHVGRPPGFTGNNATQLSLDSTSRESRDQEPNQKGTLTHKPASGPRASWLPLVVQDQGIQI